jgi:DNA-binding transcriptional ArsR family regulator
MNIKSEEAAALFKALGHPIRLTIVRGLTSRRCNVTSISEKLRLPQATVSQHLGVLRRAGIIEGTRKADGTCYRVVHPLAIAIARMLDGR